MLTATCGMYEKERETFQRFIISTHPFSLSLKLIMTKNHGSHERRGQQGKWGEEKAKIHFIAFYDDNLYVEIITFKSEKSFNFLYSTITFNLNFTEERKNNAPTKTQFN